MINKVLLKRSTVVTDGQPKLPTSAQTDYGEITLNYAAGHETIATRNNSDEIATFSNDNTVKEWINEKKPVVIYETDGTTGLLGLNESTMTESSWQLSGLTLSGFSYIKCYFKQSDLNISDNNFLAPSTVVEVPLSDATASKGSSVCTMYLGAATTILPNNRNRLYNIVVAVDSTKTKFKVAYQTYLWDISTSTAATDGKYLWKIVGYYE